MWTFFTYLKFLLSYFNKFKQLPCQFSQDYEFILDLVSLHFVLGANQRTDTRYSVELYRYVYEKNSSFPEFPRTQWIRLLQRYHPQSRMNATFHGEIPPRAIIRGLRNE